MVTAIGERSGEAVRRMEESLAQVARGVDQAGRAHAAIEGMGHSSAQVRSGIHEIDGAIQEQRVASNEIARHVEQIAQMAEQNGVSVAQIGADVRHLEQLSRRLEERMSRFRA
jgi:methyl-accepting chemotaxis protein